MYGALSIKLGFLFPLSSALVSQMWGFSADTTTLMQCEEERSLHLSSVWECSWMRLAAVPAQTFFLRETVGVRATGCSAVSKIRQTSSIKTCYAASILYRSEHDGHSRWPAFSVNPIHFLWNCFRKQNCPCPLLGLRLPASGHELPLNNSSVQMVLKFCWVICAVWEGLLETGSTPAFSRTTQRELPCAIARGVPQRSHAAPRTTPLCHPHLSLQSLTQICSILSSWVLVESSLKHVFTLRLSLLVQDIAAPTYWLLFLCPRSPFPPICQQVEICLYIYTVCFFTQLTQTAKEGSLK